jgi:hypothetical protein
MDVYGAIIERPARGKVHCAIWFEGRLDMPPNAAEAFAPARDLFLNIT